MKSIEIHERLIPFSHLPGTFVLLPLTPYRLQIFPSGFFLDTLLGVKPKRLAQSFHHFAGPFDEFTIFQDLERLCVRAVMRKKKFFLSYRIEAKETSVMLVLERCSHESANFLVNEQEVVLAKHSSYCLLDLSETVMPSV